MFVELFACIELWMFSDTYVIQVASCNCVYSFAKSSQRLKLLGADKFFDKPSQLRTKCVEYIPITNMSQCRRRLGIAPWRMKMTSWQDTWEIKFTIWSHCRSTLALKSTIRIKCYVEWMKILRELAALCRHPFLVSYVCPKDVKATISCTCSYSP